LTWLYAVGADDTSAAALALTLADKLASLAAKVTATNADDT
jgi:hypothetical protein